MELFGNKRKKKKKETPEPDRKKSRALRTLAIVLGVVVILVIAVIVGYSIWEKPPDLAGNKTTEDVQSTPGPGEKEPVQTENLTGPDNLVDDFDGALDTDRDDGVYTFLLAGRDHESNSTDTIIVGKLDTVNHTIDCVNIPRDTLINISWGSTPKKINAVYPGYTNSGKSGIDGLKTHVKNLTGFDVDCYAVVNLAVVEDVINEIGGVYFDVPIDMDYDAGEQHFHVHLKAGYQLLNGYETLGVFRYRYGNDGNTYPGGDLQRIGVQQDLMKAIASQVLTLGNIPNLANIIQLCVDNVETDLDASNMAFFARQFLKCKAEDINFHTAPTASSSLINGISYVSLDVNSWIEMVNECLNPYTESVTTANVNILTSDYNGYELSSTTGAVAGGIDSFYCNYSGCELRFSYHAPGAHVMEGSQGETDEPGVETETETGASGEEGSEETEITVTEPEAEEPLDEPGVPADAPDEAVE